MFRNKFSLISFILIILGIVLGCTGVPKNEESRPDAPNEPERSKPKMSSITWEQYNFVYNPKSSFTDLQKENEWASFKGQRVSWVGEVTEISKGMTGRVRVQIKMNKDTLTSDLILNLNKESSSKAESLQKGDRIKFVGTLSSYGGAFLPASLDDGDIK